MKTRRLRLSLLALIGWTVTAMPSLAADPSHGAIAGGEGPMLPKVEGAWVRSTVGGQQGTGVFMKLTAPQTTELVGVSSPIARVAELHQMKMEGDIMRMRRVNTLELPAGRPVELKPGGYHLMLMDLKQPVTPGSTVPLTLLFRDASGREGRLELNVAAATQPPPAAKH
jgi:copper(I)-binding protein